MINPREGVKNVMSGTSNAIAGNYTDGVRPYNDIGHCRKIPYTAKNSREPIKPVGPGRANSMFKQNTDGVRPYDEIGFRK